MPHHGEEILLPLDLKAVSQDLQKDHRRFQGPDEIIGLGGAPRRGGIRIIHRSSRWMKIAGELLKIHKEQGERNKKGDPENHEEVASDILPLPNRHREAAQEEEGIDHLAGGEQEGQDADLQEITQPGPLLPGREVRERRCEIEAKPQDEGIVGKGARELQHHGKKCD